MAKWFTLCVGVGAKPIRLCVCFIIVQCNYRCLYTQSCSLMQEGRQEWTFMNCHNQTCSLVVRRPVFCTIEEIKRRVTY